MALLITWLSLSPGLRFALWNLSGKAVAAVLESVVCSHEGVSDIHTYFKIAKSKNPSDFFSLNVQLELGEVRQCSRQWKAAKKTQNWCAFPLFYSVWNTE